MLPYFGFLYSLFTANLKDKWGDLEHDYWFEGRFSMLLEYESSFDWNRGINLGRAAEELSQNLWMKIVSLKITSHFIDSYGEIKKVIA